MEKWKFYSLLGIFIIYSSFIIGMEFYFRQPLYNYSLEFIKQEQKNNPTGTIFFFQIITHFGDQAVILPLITILYIFFPLNMAYLFFIVSNLA